MTRNLKGKGGLPDLKTYRYSFRLNETCFFFHFTDCSFFDRFSGIGNRSKFILSRLFG